MKKLLSLALALTMILSLAACGSKPQEPSSTPPVEPSVQSSAEPQPSASAEEPTPKPAPAELSTFGVSHTELIDILKDTYSDLANEPEVNQTDLNDVPVTQYMYTIADCINIHFFETEASELHSVSIMCDSSKLDKDLANVFGRLMATFTGAFEPDEATLVDVIDPQLDIANASFSDKTVNMATGTIASFLYVIDGSMAWLSISAL